MLLIMSAHQNINKNNIVSEKTQKKVTKLGFYLIWLMNAKNSFAENAKESHQIRFLSDLVKECKKLFALFALTGSQDKT